MTESSLRHRAWPALIALAVAGLGAPALSANYRDAREVYEALSQGPREALPLGAATLNLVYAGDMPEAERLRVRHWIGDAAASVEKYFGGFPVSRAGLLIVAQPGARIGGGTTWGFAGNAIRLFVGREAGDEAFRRDWQLVHEMVHLSLPDLPDRHLWFAEGVAVYVEPIARIQAGLFDEREMWRDLLRDMLKGMPDTGDQGLDRTHDWARTYWGGALFCFFADVEIHRRTGNRFGLQSALRAIARESGGHTTDWSLERTLEAGDRASGATVLMDTYRRWGDRPMAPDLSGLFRDLGVRLEGNEVVLDETAELASIRAAIIRGK